MQVVFCVACVQDPRDDVSGEKLVADDMLQFLQEFFEGESQRGPDWHTLPGEGTIRLQQGVCMAYLPTSLWSHSLVTEWGCLTLTRLFMSCLCCSSAGACQEGLLYLWRVICCRWHIQ